MAESPKACYFNPYTTIVVRMAHDVLIGVIQKFAEQCVFKFEFKNGATICNVICDRDEENFVMDVYLTVCDNGANTMVEFCHYDGCKIASNKWYYHFLEQFPKEEFIRRGYQPHGVVEDIATAIPSEIDTFGTLPNVQF